MDHVDVLGERYAILNDVNENEIPGRGDGACDWSTRTIYIGHFTANEDSVGDLKGYAKQVLRHEIVHAFLFESGLSANSSNATSWASCEEMVDWFAIQGPKILKAWQEADAL